MITRMRFLVSNVVGGLNNTPFHLSAFVVALGIVNFKTSSIIYSTPTLLSEYTIKPYLQ
jgi:hypothetical protein